MSHAMNDARKQKKASNGVGSGELVGRRCELAVRTLRAYEERVEFWLREANKYPRATYGRREAVAIANATAGFVETLRDLVPAKHRQPPSNIGHEPHAPLT